MKSLTQFIYQLLFITKPLYHTSERYYLSYPDRSLELIYCLATLGQHQIDIAVTVIVFNYCKIVNDYIGLNDDESIEINQTHCSILIYVDSVLINMRLCIVIRDRNLHD